MSNLYGFAYTEAALSFLQSGVTAKERKQIRRKIDALARDPYPPGCKKLQGDQGRDAPVYRIRSGDYRILYLVRSDPSTIVVLDIGHRKDIYR